MPDLFSGPVFASPRADPDRPAFEIGPRAVSRGHLLAIARQLTAALRDAGLGPGKGVGLVLSLSAEAYATRLAANALGCRVAAARARMEPGTTRPCPRSPGRCGPPRRAWAAEIIEGYRVSATLMPQARLHQVLRSRADLSSGGRWCLAGLTGLIDTLDAATENGWSVFDLTHYLRHRVAHTGQRF